MSSTTSPVAKKEEKPTQNASSVPISKIEGIILDRKIGPVLMAFLEPRDAANMLLLSRGIRGRMLQWDGGLSLMLCKKLAAEYSARLRQIQAKFAEQQAVAERLRKGTAFTSHDVCVEFDVQSDPEMPTIYRKYILDRQIAVADYIARALRHSRQFVVLHEVYKFKEESKGLFGSLLGAFGHKSEPMCMLSLHSRI